MYIAWIKDEMNMITGCGMCHEKYIICKSGTIWKCYSSFASSDHMLHKFQCMQQAK